MFSRISIIKINLKGYIVHMIFYVALMILFMSLSSTAIAASFDCNKAHGFIEKTICSTPELSTLDEDLSKIYKEIIHADPENAGLMKKAQLWWLKSIRNKATNAQDLKEAYIARINDLNFLLHGDEELLQSQAVNHTQVPPSPKAVISAGISPTKNTTSFYDSLEEFSSSNEAGFLSAGMNIETRKRIAKEIYNDLKSFSSTPTTKYEYTQKQYKYPDLINIYSNRNDAEAVRYFTAIGIIDNREIEPELYNFLGVYYLYGYHGVEKNTDKARLFLAYAASKGVYYARYILANDYIFKNERATIKELEYGRILVEHAPWFSEKMEILDNIKFRRENHDGYRLKISCTANTKAKTQLNIKQCITPNFMTLNGSNSKQKNISYSLSNGPAWIDFDGESVLYTPKHFNVSISNGSKNTLLKIDIYKQDSDQPEEKFEAESYQNISITR